jgi:hypothetical protein
VPLPPEPIRVLLADEEPAAVVGELAHLAAARARGVHAHACQPGGLVVLVGRPLARARADVLRVGRVAYLDEATVGVADLGGPHRRGSAVDGRHVDLAVDHAVTLVAELDGAEVGQGDRRRTAESVEAARDRPAGGRGALGVPGFLAITCGRSMPFEGAIWVQVPPLP